LRIKKQETRLTLQEHDDYDDDDYDDDDELIVFLLSKQHAKFLEKVEILEFLKFEIGCKYDVAIRFYGTKER